MRVSRARSVRTRHSRLLGCLLPAALCLLPLGCNNGGKQLQADLYQRELRLQEDEIYRLEDCLCEYQAIVRDYRSEVAELKREIATSAESSQAEKPKAITPLGPPASDLEFNAPTLPSPEPMLEPTPEPDGLEEAPAFSPTIEPAPQDKVPGDLPAPADEAPPFIPGGEAAAPSGASAYPETVATLDAPRADENKTAPNELPPAPFAPTQRSLRPLPEPGSLEGVRVTAEIRAGDGNAPDVLHVDVRADAPEAAFFGTVSLMLIDPQREGAERYLVRWDFTAEEIETALDASGQMTLPVLLPAGFEIDSSIQLWARLIDRDGVKTLKMTPLEQALAENAVEAASAGVADNADWRPTNAANGGSRRYRRDSSLRVASFVEE